MSFRIIVNEEYSFENNTVRVTKIVSPSKVEIEDFGGLKREVSVSEIYPVDVEERIPIEPNLDPETALKAKNLKDGFDHYLKTSNKAKVRDELMKELGLTQATFYRYLQTYKAFNSTYPIFKSKIKQTRRKRISSEAEDIMNKVIKNYYLTNQKIKLTHAIKQVQLECKANGVNSPHGNTIRNRVNEITKETRVKKRHGRKEFDEKFELIRGKYPETTNVLEVVQIDHGRVNVILVDEKNRELTTRPWLTLAIDIHSRVILGYYLTYKSPSFLSVGLCITNAILPKDATLQKHDLDFDWPFYGVMSNIHCDNAREFSGIQLENACAEHSIHLNLRPIGKPQYGGHVERLIGTLKSDMIVISGTTGHNKEHRKNYNSEKLASMTIKELEKWLLIDIIGVYHNSVHTGLKTTPRMAWEKSIIGDDETMGIGLPPFADDPYKLKLDFLPSFSRTIQRAGIVFNHINYRSDVLRNWVSEKNPEKKNFHFDFKVDPRDLSKVFFWDPAIKQYFEIPYADRAKTPISMWDLQRAKNKLKEEKSLINEDLIFRAYAAMREIEKQVEKRTKKGRQGKPEKSSQKLRLGISPKDSGEIDFTNLKPFKTN